MTPPSEETLRGSAPTSMADSTNVPSAANSNYDSDLGKEKAEDHMKFQNTIIGGPSDMVYELEEIATDGRTDSSQQANNTSELAPETDLPNGIIGWEGQSDPENPQNFPPRRKWLLLGLISSITFISPLASSMVAPGVPYIEKTFHITNATLGAFTVTAYLIGLIFGPLFLSPLSEIYGRRIILCIANIIFCIFQIGCAVAPNTVALILCRLIAGIGGAGCLSIGGGVIADLFRREERGKASAAYTIGPLFGPVLGPICGGFIAETVGWRWIFWVIFIAASITTIGIELLNRETYAPVLIRRKVGRLRFELSQPELRSCYEPQGERSHRDILVTGLLRPLKMIFLSPIVFVLNLYMCFSYSLLYLLFTTITPVFQEIYGWGVGLCGLAYIGIGLGFIPGLGVVTRLSDRTVIRMTAANNGFFEPEMRLPACLAFSFFMPISFFWYGWATQNHVHWIVPILGLAPFGFGMIGIFISIQTYLIDSFPLFAASATAALTASRSLFGAFLPLAAPALYRRLGFGWGNSLLGFLCILMIPATALIYKYGGMIRKRYPLHL